MDVIMDGVERLIVDIDFQSEFEIARSTKSYRAALQTLPAIFVGREERLGQIVAVVSEAARQSLKKKGLHVPPWRKPEYMRAKWLSPHQRVASPRAAPPEPPTPTLVPSMKPSDANERKSGGGANTYNNSGNGDGGGGSSPDSKVFEFMPDDDKEANERVVTSLDLIGELELRSVASGQQATSPPRSPANTPASDVAVGTNEGKGTEELARAASSAWQLPAIKPRAPLRKGVKVVTGLASIVRDLN